MKNRRFKVDAHLATEAKSIVALAFRNGPIEDVHAGTTCPTCAGKKKYSHITDSEMKRIMKKAVDTVFTLMWLKEHEPEAYRSLIESGSWFTSQWDEPKFNFKM